MDQNHIRFNVIKHSTIKPELLGQVYIVMFCQSVIKFYKQIVSSYNAIKKYPRISAIDKIYFQCFRILCTPEELSINTNGPAQ